MASSYVPVDTYKPIASLNDNEPVDTVIVQKKNKKKEIEEMQPRRVLNIVKNHKKKYD
jgi:hypothetical protein